MKEETQYFLEKGLAHSSISLWSSPCLLVQTSDSAKRFCTDYRIVTIPDCFPLSRMEDCMDSLGSAKFVNQQVLFTPQGFRNVCSRNTRLFSTT